MGSTLADKVLKKTPLDLQKRFPIYHMCPQILGGPLLRLGIPENGTAFHQDLIETFLMSFTKIPILFQ